MPTPTGATPRAAATLDFGNFCPNLFQEALSRVGTQRVNIMNRPPVIALCLLAGLLAGGTARPAEQTLYTWVDADGTVHFSDKPEHPGARPVDVASRRTDPMRVASERAAREAREKTRERALAEAAETEAEERREAERRRERCERAQARLRTLTVARRPFRVDENGQQLYLEEAQIEAEKAQARAQVAEWCN